MASTSWWGWCRGASAVGGRTCPASMSRSPPSSAGSTKLSPSIIYSTRNNIGFHNKAGFDSGFRLCATYNRFNNTLQSKTIELINRICSRNLSFCLKTSRS